MPQRALLDVLDYTVPRLHLISDAVIPDCVISVICAIYKKADTMEDRSFIVCGGVEKPGV